MSDRDVGELLEAVNSGDASSYEELIQALYAELRRMAGSFMSRERPGHTLQPTALVNEAYLRLIQGDPEWRGRSHFFGAAARAMRQILVDHARMRASQKRGGDAKRVTFSDLDVATQDAQIEVLALDEALSALAAEDERLGKVVELRCFAGCTFEEIADLLGTSDTTIRRDWTYAKAWLYEHMDR